MVLGIDTPEAVCYDSGSSAQSVENDSPAVGSPIFRGSARASAGELAGHGTSAVGHHTHIGKAVSLSRCKQAVLQGSGSVPKQSRGDGREGMETGAMGSNTTSVLGDLTDYGYGLGAGVRGGGY